MKGFYYLALLIIFSNPLFSQRGKDGAKPVTSTEIINAYTTLTTNVNAGSNSITVGSSTLNITGLGNLEAGDLIMIIQMQGATLKDGAWPSNQDETWGEVLNYNNCGNYEFLQVESVPNSTTITFSCNLTNSYTASGNVQIVRVPRYSSLTINSGGNLTVPQWNGNTGGVFAVEVLGNTVINAGGNIDVSGLGFRGGQAELNSNFGGQRYAGNDPFGGADKGEGIGGDQVFYSSSLAGRYCRGAAANGGGGGNMHNAGGAGGGNAGDFSNWNSGTGVPDPTYNTAWSLETPSIAGVISSGGGRGGYSHCSSSNDPSFTPPGHSDWNGDLRRQVGGLGGRPLDYSTGKIFMGGAGGAGDGNSPAGPGAGGNGAGIIFINTYGNVSGAGNITANGQDGFNCEAPGNPGFGQTSGKDAAGGAGAGGTILIKTTGVVSGITINANGGNGGDQVIKQGAGATIGEAEGPGGGGGGGYIAVSSGSPTTLANGGLNGVTNSTLVTGHEANGATSGGVGLPNETIDAFDILVTGDSICENNSATISASLTGSPPAGTQFEWYDAEFGGNLLFTGASFTTPILTSNTTYWVKVCPAAYLVPVNVIVTVCTPGPSVSFSASDSTLCVGDCINFTDLSTGSTIGWSWHFFGASNTSSNQQNPTNICYNSIGSFDVALVVDDGSNTDSLFIPNFITVNSLPTITASIDTSICIGDNANISVSGSATTYNWDNGLGSGTNFSVNPVINTTYHVIGTDGNGCIDMDSVIVSINPLPIVNASNDTAICIGTPVNISASGATSYTWDNGLGAGQNQSPTPLTNTTFIVTGIDINGCTDTSAVTITVNPLPTVNANVDSTSICSGSSVTFTGSGSATSYSWDNGVNDGVPFTPPSTDLYTVTGIDANGCQNTDTITVTVNSCGSTPITSFSSSDSTICIGNCIDFNDLTSGAPSSWNWYFFGADSATSSQQNPTNICYSSAGSFDVALVTTNTAGSDSLFMPNFITVNALPTVTASNDTIICSGDSASISATGAVTYNWNQGLGIGQNQGPSPISSTTYIVTGTDANGCANTDSVAVTVNICAPPVAGMSFTTSPICVGDCINFTDISSSGTPTSWTWYFFGGTPSTSNLQNPTNICYDTTGNFGVALVVSNSFGQDSNYYAAGAGITVDSCNTIPTEIIIPNVFSPNGDGQNDLFNADGTNILSLTLNIYNRWGSLLYSTSDKSAGWNGRTTSGTECSEGTYFYIFEIQTVEKTETYKGTLTLIR